MNGLLLSLKIMFKKRNPATDEKLPLEALVAFVTERWQ